MTRRNSTPEQPEEEKMSPLVQKALDDLRPVPDPDPYKWEAARQTYLAEARDFSSEAGRAASETHRENSRAGLRAFLLPLWERRPKSMLARLLILVSVLLGGTIGTVEAAQGSLPGSALYPVKLQIEDLRAARAQDPEGQAERALEAAEKRLEEAERLAERGDAIPAELGARYAEQLSLALQATDALTGSVRSEVEAEIAEELADHLEELQELQARLGRDDAALSSMRAAIEEAGAQLGGLDVSFEDDDDIEDDLDDEEDGEDLDDEDDDSDLDDEDDDDDDDLDDQDDLDAEDNDASGSMGNDDDLDEEEDDDPDDEGDDDAYEDGEDEGDADDSDSDDDDGDESSDDSGTGSDDDEEDDSGSDDGASDDDSSDDGDDQSGGDDSDDGSNDDGDDGSDDDDSDDDDDDSDDIDEDD
jgi:hypothetical protein